MPMPRWLIVVAVTFIVFQRAVSERHYWAAFLTRNIRVCNRFFGTL